ncbi:nucleic acid-binding protein [Caulobacter phage Sansa]|uniref:Nucleic acid-binding protein n=1 Tax=Caulobacter phage Sansa TaxID=1675600 RepID=A0A0K1LLV1_9CAUD|nr:nucleic acid-binding protein [Caulobacter phage Sansa]AKU43481.1 nucleic acid-binding protein [Caulobacter phage Sansa]
MTKLITLDLGGNLGVTIGPLSAEARAAQVKCFTIKLKETTRVGVWLNSATEELHRLVRENPGATWACEKPDTRGLMYFGIRKNMCLLGHVYSVLAVYGIYEMQEVTVPQAKLRLAGHGRADKDQMIAAAQAKGYSAKNEHEADACGIREVVIFGPEETKAQKAKRAAAAKRKVKEQAKGPKLL